MNLSDSMHELAKVLTSLPSDLDVEVHVKTKINDDVPPMFVEYNVEHQSGCYQRVIETHDGMISKSITLVIPD
jgi:hypothetical protein